MSSLQRSHLESEEHVPTLRRDRLDVDLEITKDDPQEAALLHSCRTGNELAREALERACGRLSDQEYVECIQRLSRSSDALELIPYSGKFAYSWVVVDSLIDPPSKPINFEELLPLTPRDRSGLIITTRSDTPEPEHVHTVRIPYEDQGSPARILQVCRTILKILPGCRVLFHSPLDAALLLDALRDHEIALVWPDEVPSIAPETREEAESEHFWSCLDEVVSTRTHSKTPHDEHLKSFLPSVVRRARALMVSESLVLQGHLAQQRSSANATILPRRLDSIASHLTRGEVYPVELNEASSEEISWRELPIGTSNARCGKRILFTCLHLLGDTLAATPLIRTYRREHPDDFIALAVADRPVADLFALCPDIDQLLLVSKQPAMELVYSGSREIIEGWSHAKEEFDDVIVCDIQEAAHTTARTHMSAAYAQLVGMEIDSSVPSLDRDAADEHFPSYGPSTPYILLARHTESGRVAPAFDENTKRWHEYKWQDLAKKIQSELGLSVVSIGTSREARLEQPPVLDLHSLSIREAAAVVLRAEAVVTVDNGIYHLAHAMRTPLVHLIPVWLGKHWTQSSSEVPHRDLCADLRKLSVRRVFDALKNLLDEGGGFTGERTSYNEAAKP